MKAKFTEGRKLLAKFCTCDKRWKHHWNSCEAAPLCEFLDGIEDNPLAGLDIECRLTSGKGMRGNDSHE
jgi:hypothetical protein